MCLTIQKLEHPYPGGKLFFWAVLLTAILLGFQANALNSGAVSITNKSGTRFILDSNSPCNGPRAGYVAYTICNTTGGVLTNLSANLSGLASGFALSGGQPASQSIGTLTPGACSTLFWYVSYPCSINQTTNITVGISDSNPGTVSATNTVTTRSAISATAGGIVSGITTGPGLLLGSSTYFDVVYDLGNIPKNGFALFQPAGNVDFDASCFQLISTEIISSAIPTVIPVGSTNTLSYIAPSSAGGGSNLVTIRFYFQVACSTFITVLEPYGANNNGNQVKYTSNFGSIDVNVPTDFPALSPCLIGSPDDFAAQQVGTGIGLEDGGDNWSASWGDYDNDGFPDLFLTTHDERQPNALYHNNGDGTFTKINSAPFSTDEASSLSSSWGDYDNDGDLDLYVANNIGFANFLYRNEGGGSFTKILNDPIVSSTGYSHGVSWGDYDNDGFLDMFVAVYWETAFNLLYHNNGDGTFREVTNNVITNEASRSVSGAWGDYDNDGLIDLFVANTGGQNNSLYRNLGGGNFERITTGNIVNDGGSSVGASWGDYNNDGHLDLFVSNAGNETSFLYKNNGNGSFTRITSGAIATDKGDAHGSAWADWDNDGDLDLFVARDGRNNSLYRNDGGDVFTTISNEISTDGGLSFGSAWADYDRDGDLDLFVANRKSTGNFLYENTKGVCNNWTSIELAGSNSNQTAIGAKVTVTAVIDGQSVSQTREVTAQSGGGTGGQNEMLVHFGLGNASTVTSIVVNWPSGYRQTLTNQPINQFLSITEDNASEVSGMVYHEENIVCSSGLPSAPAASQTATYRTAQAGNWTSSSTWVGGNVPSYSNINNRTISIEHDVTIPNGNIYITGNNTSIWVTNAKLKLTNGNLTIDRGALKLLRATLEMNNGNFDIVGTNARFEAIQSSVTISGNHYSIGKKRWQDACLQVGGSYNNGGPDTLQNVKMTVAGNFQNYQFGIMVVNGAKVHVTNGGFQNISPATMKGSGLVIWLDNGNIQNLSIWTASISQYCTPNWAITVGVIGYLPPAKDCATIAAQFAVDPCALLVADLSGRVGIPFARIVFQPGDITVYTDENGYYSAFLPTGTYTAQEYPGSNFEPRCPNTAGNMPLTVTGPGQQYSGRDFGNSIINNLPDLFTEVVTTAHRIGEHNLMIVNYKNLGTAAATAVQLEVSVPSDIEVLLSSMPYAAQKSGNTVLVFSPGDLLPNAQGIIYVSYTVGLMTPIGTEIMVAANIFNGSPEITTANNTSMDMSQAVAAYDPNDISVSPGRFVKRGEWLHYKIRFQNVGNLPAAQVRVVDELPESLDLATLELGGVSHTYKLQVEGRKLVWSFPNINLPDSLSNETESHGYITFRIKPKESLTIGDRMPNRAAIYFDNLQPVMTNTVENVLVDELVKESKAIAKPLQIFPNPASGMVTVQSFDLSLEPDAFFVEMRLFDQFGRQVYQAPQVATQRQELYLFQLTSGTYHVRAVDSKGRTYFGKVVLMKN